jgi:hypothetical protein
MTPEEKRAIEEEAKADARWESRLEAVERSVTKLWYGVGAAAFMILASIWEQLKQVLFK